MIQLYTHIPVNHNLFAGRGSSHLRPHSRVLPEELTSCPAPGVGLLALRGLLSPLLLIGSRTQSTHMHSLDRGWAHKNVGNQMEPIWCKEKLAGSFWKRNILLLERNLPEEAICLPLDVVRWGSELWQPSCYQLRQIHLRRSPRTKAEALIVLHLTTPIWMGFSSSGTQYILFLF